MTEELTSDAKQDQLGEQKNIICENCHAVVNGKFCGQCGQSTESTIAYFWTVLLHILDDIFSFDSRASRTLFPLLFKPGFLTNEYIAGRRVHYVPPLRLYLFVSIIFFLSLKFFINTGGNDFVTATTEKEQISQEINQVLTKLNNELQQGNNPKAEPLKDKVAVFEQYLKNINQQENTNLATLTTQLANLELQQFNGEQPLSDKQQQAYDKIKQQLANAEFNKQSAADFSIGNNADGSLTFSFLAPETNKILTEKTHQIETKVRHAIENDPKKLIQQTVSKLPQIMFVLLPVFALLLKLMFIFSKRLYLEHLTVALHSHSFIFLVILILQLLDLLFDALQASQPTIADGLSLIAVLLFTWLPIYLFLMQKNVYKQGYFLTTIKYSIIGFLYFMLIGISGLTAFIWGVVEG